MFRARRRKCTLCREPLDPDMLREEGRAIHWVGDCIHNLQEARMLQPGSVSRLTTRYTNTKQEYMNKVGQLTGEPPSSSSWNPYIRALDLGPPPDMESLFGMHHSVPDNDDEDDDGDDDDSEVETEIEDRDGHYYDDDSQGPQGGHPPPGGGASGGSSSSPDQFSHGNGGSSGSGGTGGGAIPPSVYRPGPAYRARGTDGSTLMINGALSRGVAHMYPSQLNLDIPSPRLLDTFKTFAEHEHSRKITREQVEQELQLADYTFQLSGLPLEDLGSSARDLRNVLHAQEGEESNISYRGSRDLAAQQALQAKLEEYRWRRYQRSRSCGKTEQSSPLSSPIALADIEWVGKEAAEINFIAMRRESGTDLHNEIQKSMPNNTPSQSSSFATFSPLAVSFASPTLADSPTLPQSLQPSLLTVPPQTIRAASPPLPRVNPLRSVNPQPSAFRSFFRAQGNARSAAAVPPPPPPVPARPNPVQYTDQSSPEFRDQPSLLPTPPSSPDASKNRFLTKWKYRCTPPPHIEIPPPPGPPPTCPLPPLPFSQSRTEKLRKRKRSRAEEQPPVAPPTATLIMAAAVPQPSLTAVTAISSRVKRKLSKRGKAASEVKKVSENQVREIRMYLERVMAAESTGARFTASKAVEVSV
ncbi:MAG: hypothetical protein Q9227_000255 [Pyrenula ochraceoflavens]